jgi:phosphoribosylaminoimidazolecarboxamide formyltransferase/IMP cyclohydrolase
VVIVKHTNPCGVARAARVLDAYKLARDADPVSAFGGIVAFSHAVDAATGAALAETFLEAVIAPAFEQGALDALKPKKSLRLLEVPLLGQSRETWTQEPREMRSIPGGLLLQTRDLAEADPRGWRTVTKRAPTPEELEALAFAWSVVKHVKSNAIVLARGDVTVGIGMGQTNRVDSVRIAAQRAGEKARGAALGSDAFFPFPDGVEAAGAAGVTAIAQPGGSVRDDEVIAVADKLGIAMVFTGVRHFRH